MIRLSLSLVRGRYPIWWVNFLDSTFPTVGGLSGTQWRTECNRYLRPYMARVVPDDNAWALEFDSEEDVTIFLLRWS